MRKEAVRDKDRQIQQLQQQLEQSMIMSQEAIQALNRRVQETEQCIRMKELEVSHYIQFYAKSSIE